MVEGVGEGQSWSQISTERDGPRLARTLGSESFTDGDLLEEVGLPLLYIRGHWL